MIDLGKQNLLGVLIDAVDYDAATERVVRAARERRPYTVSALAVHGVMTGVEDAEHRHRLNSLDLVTPDGQAVRWGLNLLHGTRLRDRVYGPTFMRRAVENSPAPWTHYLLGGSEECLTALRRRFGEAQIVGAHHGYFSPDDESEILSEINRLAPDFIWVGLGTPKQQDWIHRHKGAITRGVIFAVGFAFDVNAGLKPDAPAWMQRLGLTWLFRAASEPRRLLTRYLRYNSLFLYYLLKDEFFARRS